jgi:fluoride exporter
MLLWIAAGGALGTLFRYLLGGPVTALVGGRFPLGTLVINVLGSFAIGLFARTFLHSQTTPALRAALTVGLCGGFTTFSTFSLETVALMEGGLYGRAAGYVLASVTLSIFATFAGFAAGKLIALP